MRSALNNDSMSTQQHPRHDEHIDAGSANALACADRASNAAKGECHDRQNFQRQEMHGGVAHKDAAPLQV